MRFASLAVLVTLALTGCVTTSPSTPNGWAAAPRATSIRTTADTPPRDRAPRRADDRTRADEDRWAERRAEVRERGRTAERGPSEPAEEAAPTRRVREPLVDRLDRLRREARGTPAMSGSGAVSSTGFALTIPVVGIEPGDLRDTFHSPRSGGRVHNSIDIAAPTGTPLVAIADGTITRMHWNRLGGRTLYLTSADGQYDFYYAHLDEYAAGLEIGDRVSRGDVIGTVGETGNARGPHLHFQVLDKSGSGRGTPVNPYHLLQMADVAFGN